MKALKPVLHEGTLYEYSAGVLFGVLVKEPVMKKLARLQNSYLESMRRLLSDESDNGTVFSGMWTLHYPHGEQTVVTFIDNTIDTAASIKSATHAAQPIHRPLVFVAGSMEEAREMADAHFEQAETSI